MEENHIAKNNIRSLFKEDTGHHIAILINPQGKTDFFGDPVYDNHGTALEKYFKKHEIEKVPDAEHFLPHVYTMEEAKDKLFNEIQDSHQRRTFNQYMYANYLITILNNMGYIFIKDFTSFKSILNNVLIFVPTDFSKVTPEQREILKDVNYKSYERNIELNVVGYKDYKDAVNDNRLIYNLNELLYNEEEEKKCTSQKK